MQTQVGKSLIAQSKNYIVEQRDQKSASKDFGQYQAFA